MQHFQEFTTIFLIQNNRILLGYKKKGFGEKKWNGFGGKIEQNETIIQGAKREIQEECGITPTNLEYIGLIKYTLPYKSMIGISHQFVCTEYIGNIIETDEMKPQWFEFNDIPYNHMWCENYIWYNDMINTQYFYGEYTMNGPEILLEQKHMIIKQSELFEYQQKLSLLKFE